MKILKHFSHALAMVGSAGLIIPQPVLLADEPVPVAASVLDIKLDRDGSFRGSMLTAEGTRQPGAIVQLQQRGETVVQRQADHEGRFVMHPPKGGLYQLVSGRHVAHVRCWTGSSAPPHAQSQVQFIQGRVARGQGCTDTSCTTPGCDPCGGGGVCGFLMNPLVIGTAIAAAIAIPLALDDDDDDAS